MIGNSRLYDSPSITIIPVILSNDILNKFLYKHKYFPFLQYIDTYLLTGKILIMMRLTLLIALILASQTIFAQEEESEDKTDYLSKGRFFIAQSAGGSIAPPDDFRSFGISLYPRGGYFVADRFLVGALLAYNYTSYKGDEREDFSSFIIGPGVRYYLPNFLFLEVGYGVYLDNSSNDVDGAFQLQAGYAWFINRTFAVEPTLFIEPDQNFRFSLNIGFSIYLN